MIKLTGLSQNVFITVKRRVHNAVPGNAVHYIQKTSISLAWLILILLNSLSRHQQESSRCVCFLCSPAGVFMHSG